MSSVRIELNSAGVRELLRSGEMGEIVYGLAASAATRCGDGYSADRKLMPTRVVASVFTETKEAMRDNMQNNTILRNLK